MKILITNIHSLHNAGDTALLCATVQQLRQNFPGCRLSLAVNLPATFDAYQQEMKAASTDDPWMENLQVVGSFMYFARQHGGQGNSGWDVPALLRLLWSSIWLAVAKKFRGQKAPLSEQQPHNSPDQLLQAYLEADLVISVAGNYLYHSGRFGLSLLLNLYSMAYGPLLGKPLYLFPQSIGPLARGWETGLTKWVLARARIVMVREAESMRFLVKQHFEHAQLRQVPDVAFAFQGFNAQAGQEWLQVHGVSPDPVRPRLGLTAINWWVQTNGFTYDQQLYYEAALLDACRMFMEEMGGEVVIFTQVTGEADIARDDIPARRIFERLQDYSGRIHLIDRGAIPQVLQPAYSQMDIFIGTRMHSNIFALTGGVPVAAVAYRYKTTGLMETLGLERWVVNIDQLGSEAGRGPFLELVRELWQQAPVLRPQIQARVAELAERSRQAGRLVAQDYTLLMEQEKNTD